MPKRSKPTLAKAQWGLKLLGSAQVERGKQPPLILERKPAAVLAYIALEGPTPRPKLAGLLWPDSGEETARNNLRKLLQRFRDNVGDEVLIAEDVLRLSADLEVDAVTLETLGFTGDYSVVTSLEGELLTGFNYDDCPDIAEWLDRTRERIEASRLEAYTGEAERLEMAGDYAEALEWAERLLNKDPLSEEVYRQIMRLHYLLGDRSAALKTYQKCHEVLRKEFGVEPLRETLELLHEIERSAVLPQPTPQPKPKIPLTVLRPPVLAGREHEWAMLEEAWEQGQLILIAGDPGVGKSRLLQDFVSSKGIALRLEGRPGDASLPFVALVRLLEVMSIGV